MSCNDNLAHYIVSEAAHTIGLWTCLESLPPLKSYLQLWKWWCHLQSSIFWIHWISWMYGLHEQYLNLVWKAVLNSSFFGPQGEGHASYLNERVHVIFWLGYHFGTTSTWFRQNHCIFFVSHMSPLTNFLTVHGSSKYIVRKSVIVSVVQMLFVFLWSLTIYI